MATNGTALAADMGLDYEPFDPRFREEPEQFYRLLREQAPAYRSKSGYWVFTRYDDVKSGLLDHSAYSNAMVGREALSQSTSKESVDLPGMDRAPVDLPELLATPNMVSTDPPRHSELRRIVNRAFLPKRLARWDEYIAACTAECLEAVSEDESWDVVSQLSMPLPVKVICRILGLSPDRAADIKRWSDTIIETAQGDKRRTEEARLTMLQMLLEFSQCFAPLIAERRSSPGDDMLSDLVRAEQGETLSTLDTLTFIKSLMLAGNETTTGLIGNTIVLLLQNPAELAKVQADPGLVKNTIEESLRFRSPVQFAVRTPNENMHLHGMKIGKDEPILLSLGGANRDPAQFADPDRFDVTRSASTHLGFGQGIHTCIGFHLARREAAAALGAIIPRLHHWRLAGAPLERIGSNFVFGYKKINLVPAA